ncbi:MAG: hypothetical protein R3Y47_02600 [Lachnospiraceae bacterium]
MLNKFRKIPLLTVVTICLFVMISYAMTSVETTNSQEQMSALEDAVMRSAIHCYSLEGAYPTDISYLEEHYNLVIDWDSYIVHYEMFASNIAPDITVIVRTSQTGGGS